MWKKISESQVQIHEGEEDENVIEKHRFSLLMKKQIDRIFRPALGVVEELLLALSNADKDGRIVISTQGC